MLELDTNRQVICGNSEDVLFQLPENSVHLIVTSPPYNVGISYGNGHNDNLPEQEYFDWTRKWLTGCHRVLVEGGRICVNIPDVGNTQYSKAEGLQTYIDKYIPMLRSIGFKMREIVSWIKTDELGTKFAGANMAWGSYCSPNNPFLRSFGEMIVVAHKGRADRGRTEKGDMTPEEFVQYTRNMWFMMPENDRSQHPAPFPIELPKRCIKLFTWKGDTVLDPFAGRGTTLVAAELLGRNYIGIEQNPAFVEICKKNIDRHRYQSRLMPFEEGEDAIPITETFFIGSKRRRDAHIRKKGQATLL